MAPSNLDLCSLADAKSWLVGLNQNITTDDEVLQDIITAWGYEFLLRTGFGDMNNDFVQSPFAAVCSFNETYDGTGTYRLFLRNRPIVNVSSVTINDMGIAPSASVATQGYVVDGSRKSIALRSGIPGTGAPAPIFSQWQSGPFYALTGLRFWQGIQNVNVQYSAGYANTPYDIQQCAKIVVAQNYKRRNFVDEMSRSVAGGGGTIRYRDWSIPVECSDVINRYMRTL